MYVAQLVILLWVSPTFRLFFEYAPSDLPDLWILKLMFDRAMLGLIWGVGIGVVADRLVRSQLNGQIEANVNRYFLARNERRLEWKNRDYRNTFLRMFGRLIAAQVVLFCGSLLFGISYVSAAVASILVLHILAIPRSRAVITEIQRRRHIALAWESDEPNGRLSVGQKLWVGSVWAFGCAFVVITGLLVHATETEFNWARMTEGLRAVKLHDNGGLLSDEEADALDRRLEESPIDHEARLKLIGYHWEQYVEARKAKDVERVATIMHGQIPHARYFIENLPGHVFTEVARSAMPFRTDDPDYQEIADLWRAQIDKFPEDADVLWNAAWFFKKPDDAVYEELLERGRALEPDNERWSDALDEFVRKPAAYPTAGLPLVSSVTRMECASSLALLLSGLAHGVV